MNAVTLWFHKLGSPPYFYSFANRWQPWFLGTALITGAIAIYQGLFIVPADALQGEAFRILYIHVPCAWMSLFVYGVMALNGFIALVWRIKLSEILAMACAPIGAAFTAICLITGALWGRPAWGTYWVWDARLTSELVLLFLYFGVIGLHQAIEDPRKAARAASLLALIGVVNIPIIHFSVEWWNTLHQGASIKLMSTKSSIDKSMLGPLLWMTLATKLYFVASLLSRARLAVLEQDSAKDWVRRLVLGDAPASDPTSAESA